MATTVTAATLTVTLTEGITVGGYDQGATHTFTIPSVKKISNRTVTCPASNTTIVASFSANVYDSVQAFDTENTKYIRIINLDDTNSLELAIVGAATLYQVTLAPGQFHQLPSPDDAMLAEADTSPSFGTMADIASIQVNPGGNAIDVAVYMAAV
jgi:hypothetical protein